jgi:hypothetical protein
MKQQRLEQKAFANARKGGNHKKGQGGDINPMVDSILKDLGYGQYQDE